MRSHADYREEKSPSQRTEHHGGLLSFCSLRGRHIPWPMLGSGHLTIWLQDLPRKWCSFLQRYIPRLCSCGTQQGGMGIHEPCPGSLAEFASSLIWMHNERLMLTGLTLGQSPVVDTNVVLGIIFNIRSDHYPWLASFSHPLFHLQ